MDADLPHALYTTTYELVILPTSYWATKSSLHTHTGRVFSIARQDLYPVQSILGHHGSRHSRRWPWDCLALTSVQGIETCVGLCPETERRCAASSNASRGRTAPRPEAR
jgi:hypothetical protein